MSNNKCWIILLSCLSLQCRRYQCDCPPECNTPQEQLWKRFMGTEYGKNDIGQHASTLRLYASRGNHVTEMGVQWGHSTWALLQGLHDAEKREIKVHRAYDIAPYPKEIDTVRLAASIDIEYSFVRDNVLDIEIEETDLLFIDTFHAYPHLRAELRRHAKRVRKYIILHDTTVDGNYSECTRLEVTHDQYNCDRLAQDFGFSPDEIRIGLWPAVQEFLASRPEWNLIHRYSHNNGLTVLERREAPDWKQLHCDLNLATPEALTDGTTGTSWRLLPDGIFQAHEQFIEHVSKEPSGWAFARLGILVAFFALPLQRTEDARAKTMSIARQHLTNALELDPAQPHALLAYAHSYCPHWHEGLSSSSSSQAACSEHGAALAEEHFRMAAETHDMWEAHLALYILLASRGAMEEAAESHRRADPPATHPPPMSEAYWQSILCRATAA